MSHFQRESPMEFEWDESKRRLVIDRRGIDFRDAVPDFRGSVSGNTVDGDGGRAVARSRISGRNRNRSGLHDPERPPKNYYCKTGTNK